MSYKKNEITLETLLNKEFKQYMGIIALTHHFQNVAPRKGLELKHYRYALVIKDDLKPKYINEMSKFFKGKRKPNVENHLKDDSTAIQYRMMCEMKEIEKCISSRQNLSKNYLKNLLDAGYLVKYTEKRKTPLYRIAPGKKDEIDVLIRKYQLKRCIIAKINDSTNNDFQRLQEDILKILLSEEKLKNSISVEHL